MKQKRRHATISESYNHYFEYNNYMKYSIVSYVGTAQHLLWLLTQGKKGKPQL